MKVKVCITLEVDNHSDVIHEIATLVGNAADNLAKYPRDYSVDTLYMTVRDGCGNNIGSLEIISDDEE